MKKTLTCLFFTSLISMPKIQGVEFFMGEPINPPIEKHEDPDGTIKYFVTERIRNFWHGFDENSGPEFLETDATHFTNGTYTGHLTVISMKRDADNHMKELEGESAKNLYELLEKIYNEEHEVKPGHLTKAAKKVGAAASSTEEK